MRYERALRGGDDGIQDTICLMQKFINDYKNNAQIKKLVAQHKGETDWATAKSLFNFVVRTIRYQSDPEEYELVKSVKHTVLGNSRYGDCDDLSVALATLFEASGIKSKLKTVAWRPNKKAFTHVYVLAYIKEAKGWVSFDPTMGAKGISQEVKYHRAKVYNDGSKACWIR